MNAKQTPGSRSLRFQVDEHPPPALSFLLGLQLAALTLTVPILIPTAVMRTAGMTESYIAWAVFAALAISGVLTILQAFRFGWIGGGHILISGSSGAFIGIAILAVSEGGPPMLATLVVTTSIFQLIIASRLAFFRRILTPTVSGSVLLLVPVSVIPFVFEMLNAAPEGTPSHASPTVALLTILVVLGISLTGNSRLRQWGPLIGLIVGATASAYFGLLDIGLVSTASWIGLPDFAAPGLSFEFDSVFRVLLPAFLITGVISSIRSISSNIALQTVAWRSPRPIDYRAVQGTAILDGLGNALCGLAGTVPNTTYSVAAPLIEISGVAARTVGVATGVIFLSLAFMPKPLAVILAIPGPVVAAYLFILTGMLFMIGVGMIAQGGFDHHKSIIVGVSFWLGFGIENDAIFPELVAEFAGGIFASGITTGGLAAILMSWLHNLSGRRAFILDAEFEISALPKIREFLAGFTAHNGWDSEIADRLEAVAEETLLTLLQREPQEDRPDRTRRLRLAAARKEGGSTLEFTVAPGEETLQERLALLETVPGEETRMVQEASLRLLRHLGASLKHQQYHDVDIVNVEVTLPGRTRQNYNDRA